MSINDFNRGWRAALNALALRFDHPDLPAVPRWMHAELVALLNAPPSCATCEGEGFVNAGVRHGCGPSISPRRCPDCATPQQAPTGTGGDDVPPCGGNRCFRAANGTWIHSSKSYGTCTVRNPPADAKAATCGECSDCVNGYRGEDVCPCDCHWRATR